jgi:hypothetical protein
VGARVIQTIQTPAGGGGLSAHKKFLPDLYKCTQNERERDAMDGWIDTASRRISLHIFVLYYFHPGNLLIMLSPPLFICVCVLLPYSRWRGFSLFIKIRCVHDFGVRVSSRGCVRERLPWEDGKKQERNERVEGDILNTDKSGVE